MVGLLRTQGTHHADNLCRTEDMNFARAKALYRILLCKWATSRMEYVSQTRLRGGEDSSEVVTRTHVRRSSLK